MTDNNFDIELPLSSLEDLNFPSQESDFFPSWEMLKVNQGETVEYVTGEEGVDRLEVTGDHTIIQYTQPQSVIDDFLSKQFLQRPSENQHFSVSKQPLHRMIQGPQAPVADVTCGIADIPSNNNWKGDYDFDVEFPIQKGKATKTSVTYLYSEVLDKLYIQSSVGCIVEFKLNQDPLPGSVIRAMAIFEKPEDILEVVKRCPTHVLPNCQENSGFDYPEHLIRCESERAVYVVGDDGRHSVITPYVPPPVGVESFRSIFKFMCLGSCTGGINRRPVLLIFSLEHNGQCLGRRVIHLRVCACPARDLKTDEAQHAKRLNGELPTTKVMKRVTETELMTVEPPSKRAKDSDDDQTFTITFETKNRATFEMLQRLRETIQLENIVPPEIAKSYHRRQTQLPCTISSAVGASCSSDSTYSVGLPFHRTNSLGRDAVHSSANGRPETVTSEPITVKTEKPDSIDSWLQSIGKEDLSQTFMDNDVMQVNQLERLTEDEWKALSIDESELKEIRAAFNSSNVTSSFSQESQSSAANQPGYIRISRVSFKRVSSLKREEQKPQ